MQAILAAHDHFHAFFDGGWTWFWPVAVALHIAFWALVIWLVVRFARPWLRARQPKGAGADPRRAVRGRHPQARRTTGSRLEMIRTSQGLR